MKTLAEFKEYITEMELSAGDACQASGGTTGCDEASFYSDILKEIKRFVEPRAGYCSRCKGLDDDMSGCEWCMGTGYEPAKDMGGCHENSAQHLADK